jgi:hypothetical protein
MTVFVALPVEHAKKTPFLRRPKHTDVLYGRQTLFHCLAVAVALGSHAEPSTHLRLGKKLDSGSRTAAFDFGDQSANGRFQLSLLTATGTKHEFAE